MQRGQGKGGSPRIVSTNKEDDDDNSCLDLHLHRCPLLETRLKALIFTPSVVAVVAQRPLPCHPSKSLNTSASRQKSFETRRGTPKWLATPPPPCHPRLPAPGNRILGAVSGEVVPGRGAVPQKPQPAQTHTSRLHACALLHGI